MAFDIQSATNEIARLERTITTPLPGIVNSYDWGAEPIELDGGDLPAVIHTEQGFASDAETAGFAISNLYRGTFTTQSQCFLIEDVAGMLPLEFKTLQRDLAPQLFALFNNIAQVQSLTQLSGATIYGVSFLSPSFVRLSYPTTGEIHTYWSIVYDHVFTVLTDGASICP